MDLSCACPSTPSTVSMRSSIPSIVVIAAATHCMPRGVGPDDLRSSVGGVRLPEDVAELLEFVYELAHALRGHIGPPRELGQTGALRSELAEHGRVLGLLRISRTHDAVDDLESEEAVGATQHRHGVHAVIGGLARSVARCHTDDHNKGA